MSLKNRLPTMFLVVCATEFELEPLLELPDPAPGRWATLVTGVGVVETTLHLSRHLSRAEGTARGEVGGIAAVLNLGVGGAYLDRQGRGADILDICLAERECLGDLGICYPDRIEPLPGHLQGRRDYALDGVLLTRAKALLETQGRTVRCGNFVTVSGATGTKERGAMLGQQYDALCENMEGAAVARVCQEFGLPLLELRCISNFVEDRDLSRWQLRAAADQAAQAAAVILKYGVGS